MRYITRIPENEISRNKIKSRNACEKYWNVLHSNTATLYRIYQKERKHLC